MMEINEELELRNRQLKEFDESWDLYTDAIKTVVGHEKYQQILLLYWALQEKSFKEIKGATQ